MTELKIQTLALMGYNGKPLPNRLMYYEPDSAQPWLAVILPGLQYTCDMPLLYYAAKLLMTRNVEVLQMHTDYTQPAFRNATAAEQTLWILEDTRGAVNGGLGNKSYAGLILVGKSIGTLAMAHLINNGVGSDAVTVWLTPLFHQPFLVDAILHTKGPVLIVAGGGDSTYDAATLAMIRDTIGAEAFLVEGANHSLELPGDPLRSLRCLSEIMEGMSHFLDHHLKTPS